MHASARSDFAPADPHRGRAVLNPPDRPSTPCDQRADGVRDCGVAGGPSGTVTFLFTDIEGSTRLWLDHPEAMVAALARHDAILRESIESVRGRVFDDR